METQHRLFLMDLYKIWHQTIRKHFSPKYTRNIHKNYNALCLKFSNERKAKSKGQAGGLGQFRTQQKDKTKRTTKQPPLFRRVHPTLFHEVGSLIGSGGWVT